MVLFHLWYFPPYFFCKVNANERNESLLSSCRVQLNFCKVNANERNGKEILSFYLLRYMISIIFISIFRPCSKSFLRLRFHPHQEPAATFAHLSYIKNEAASRLYTPRCLILYISLPRIKIILYIFIPRAKIAITLHLLLRHKSFPSLVIIEDANLGNFPLMFVSYFDSCLRIIIWCTINTLSSLK